MYKSCSFKEVEDSNRIEKQKANNESVQLKDDTVENNDRVNRIQKIKEDSTDDSVENELQAEIPSALEVSETETKEVTLDIASSKIVEDPLEKSKETDDTN